MSAKVIAASEGSPELPIEEKRHTGVDRAGSDRIARNQACDRGYDEGCFPVLEEDVSRAGRLRWRIGGALLPRDSATNRLRGPAELAVMHGGGSAEFEYDAASDTFRPGGLTDQPPQANDAKCGFACHTIVKSRDYVFTDYGKG